MLIGVFASVAIALAAIGLYGIIAYTVAQQRGEIGIRLALGRAMSTLLYGISIYDPVTFIATPLILALTGLMAGYLPARRKSIR